MLIFVTGCNYYNYDSISLFIVDKIVRDNKNSIKIAN